MIKLPVQTTALWEQNNRSDVLGSLWASLGLDLTTQLGKTRVSPRSLITTNGITNLGCPVAFAQFSSKNWCVAGSYLFHSSDTYAETAFTQDATSGTPTSCSSDYSDLEVYYSKLWTTAGANLYYNDGTWHFIDNGGGSSGLTSTAPHKLMSFLSTGRLYLIDSNQVKSVNQTTLSSGSSYTFTLSNSQSGLTMVSLLQAQNLIWILTFNPSSSTGYVITWDGITQDTPTNTYPLDSRGVMAGIVKDGVPYIVTADGRLQYHNGQTFVDAKNPWLPVSLRKYLKNPFDTANDRWIHPNGICLNNGRINILVNNQNYDSGATINESLPSGVWEYDGSIGWYHKVALSQFDTSVGTVTDYGQNRVSRVGALSNLRPADNSSNTYTGNLLIGADYFSDASSTVSAIWTNDSKDTTKKSGYLTTVKIPAKNIQDSWSRLFLRIKKLLNSTDKIVVKYRTSDPAPTEVSIIWDSATTFHTSTDISAYAVGDEVEGIQGNGSGSCAHIAGITVASGVYTVILDDSMADQCVGTAKVRLQKWIKLGSYSKQTEDVVQFGSMGNSTWVEVKVYFKWAGENELIDLLIDNKPYQ